MIPNHPNQNEAPERVAAWGRQTIAFAMSVRAQEVGKPLDDRNRLAAANSEARAIAQDLWEAAFKDCQQPVQLPEMTMKFAKRVLDWAGVHRG